MSILPYALQVIQPLKELFTQDKYDDIPDIKLNPNSDIHLISSNVTSLAITQQAADSRKKQIAGNFDTIAEFVQDPHNLPRLEAIEHTSKALGALLENSYHTITSNIATEVTDLKDKIHDRYVVLMKREKAEDLLNDSSEANEDDYTILKWGKLTSPVRQNEIIEQACLNANISATALSLVNRGYIIQKMKFTEGYSEVTLTEEVTNNILDKLIATFTNDTYGITEERVRNFWSIITSPTKYGTFCNVSKKSISDLKDIAINTMFLIQQSSNFDTISSSFINLIDGDLGEDTVSTLNANIELLQRTIYAIQYASLVNKEIKFKGKLILTKHIINNEAYDNFIKDGNTISDVHNYIKAFHMDTTIPSNGISTTMIENADATERLAKASVKMQANATFIKSKSLIGAFEYVLNDYISDVVKTEQYSHTEKQSIIHKFSTISRSKANTLAGCIGKVDDALYDILIQTFHHDSVVSSVHKYLSSSFEDLSRNETDIDEADIVKAEAFGVCELLTEYLFDRLVVPPHNPYKPKGSNI